MTVCSAKTDDTSAHATAHMVGACVCRRTERLNTFWLNQKLKALGDDAEVTEPTECVKNGVLIMRILELLSGKTAK